MNYASPQQTPIKFLKMKEQNSRAGSLAEGCPAAWLLARGAYASRAGDPGFGGEPA